MGRPRSAQVCCSSICLREIDPAEKAVSLTVFSSTLGMGKRRTSKSQRLFLCPQCANRTVVGKEPTKATPFDQAIFRTLLDLLGAHSDVMEAAYDQVRARRQAILYPPDRPELPEGEVLPPLPLPRRLREAS